MPNYIPILVLFIILFVQSNLLAQRGHEIQVQTGIYINWGVKFYDYHESETKRHNFEFDHLYDASFLSLGWHYPVNGYIDIGFFFSKSHDGSLELLQAEAFLFEQAGTPETAELFAGATDFDSRYTAYGFDFRINHLIRSNKYKFYFILSPGYQKLNIFLGDDEAFETEDESLKQDLKDTFTGTEKFFVMGYGFGVSYPLRNGINLKLIEIYDRFSPTISTSDFLSSGHSLELRIGASYQFYRKK